MTVPSTAERHLLSRFSFGVTEPLLADSADLGGARAWFEDQLEHATTTDDAGLDGWWPHLEWSIAELDAADASGELPGGEAQADFQRWTLLQRIYSAHQVLEVMVDMWSNLLHVPAPQNATFRHRASYDATIRAHALGRFDELLVAADTHPAMLISLDNANSTAKAPNENLGREVLELHTVGREAAFSEAEVHDSSMIFTGWRVDLHETWEPYYSPEDHYVGPVAVLGFTHSNSNPDGREVTEEYLRWLAREPATARRVCERLAVRFVTDEPSTGLVDDLADVYLASGTDIRQTLRALVDHPAFAASVGAKVRTPTEDLVNTYRVMDVDVHPPTGADGEAAIAILSQSQAIGQRPFDWAPPDGFPDVAPAWSSASRVLGSWKVHRNTAAEIYPKVGVTYRSTDDWLPPLPASFDSIVDDVCRRVLARPATDAIIDAASTATGIARSESITPDSPLVTFRMPQLLTAVLDTPEHMTR